MVFVSILHVVVCVTLILIILLQTGKGQDMGAIFGGGGSQTLFGSSGGAGFFSKLTTGAAIVFMLTCLTLAYMSAHEDTVMPAEADVESSMPAGAGQKAAGATDEQAGADQTETAAEEETTAGSDAGETKTEKPTTQEGSGNTQTDEPTDE